MPEFNLGDEVLVPATVVAKNSHGQPIVAFKRLDDRLAYLPHRVVAPDAILAPAPAEYVFTFDFTIVSQVAVKATDQDTAYTKALERVIELTGTIELSEVTLNGEGVGEWPLS